MKNERDFAISTPDYQTVFGDLPIRHSNFDLHTPIPADPAAISEDSRFLQKQGLYFALRGEKTDGHRYLEAAAAQDCVAVVEALPEGYPGRYLQVADSRAANAFFWSRFYRDPGKDLPIVAVTGTNGKTTLTHMLEAIAGAAGLPCARIGTGSSCICGEVREQTLTTPMPRDLYALLRQAKDRGAKAVFMEASSHAIAYGKLLPLQPQVAVFTGLGEDHLDYHGSMEAYAAAKAALFRTAGSALLNGDSPYAETMRGALRQDARCRICSASSRFADYMAQNIELRGTEGVRYDLISAHTAIHVDCPAPGDFHVMNSLQAAAVALELGIAPEDIARGLRRFTGADGRMDPVYLPGAGFRAYVDYAHTPDALRRALQTLRKSLQGDGRLIAVFGCGGDRDREKRPLMGRVAAEESDRVILTEDNSRGEDPEKILAQIAAGIPAEFPKVHWQTVPDRREAIAAAVAMAREGDILLIAGKGKERYTVRGGRDTRIPYAGDDRILEEAYVALQAKASGCAKEKES